MSGTFQLDVHILPQPRVDAVAGGIFRNGIVLYPASTGVLEEVIAGGSTAVHLAEDRARCHKRQKDKSVSRHVQRCTATKQKYFTTVLKDVLKGSILSLIS